MSEEALTTRVRRIQNIDKLIVFIQVHPPYTNLLLHKACCGYSYSWHISKPVLFSYPVPQSEYSCEISTHATLHTSLIHAPCFFFSFLHRCAEIRTSKVLLHSHSSDSLKSSKELKGPCRASNSPEDKTNLFRHMICFFQFDMAKLTLISRSQRKANTLFYASTPAER